MDPVGFPHGRVDAGVPVRVQTARLVLRPWRADDAAALLDILEANRSHLGPWIPARVAEPAPLPALAERLDSFAQAFAEDREWRYAITAAADDELLGEASLFPRSARSRVSFAAADRVEVGYWLRSDRTGTGLATEAARALCGVADALAPVSQIEIRCDARNQVSAAVPKRLGFSLTATEESTSVAGDATAPVHVQVWTRATRLAV
jgi:RimJ/RimL family protein N-acetyltransferase